MMGEGMMGGGHMGGHMGGGMGSMMGVLGDRMLINGSLQPIRTVERRAYRGFIPAPLERGELEAVVQARELFHTRPRHCANDAEGFALAGKRLNQALTLVGREVACHLFFEVERAYWESRNRAARIQKLRQDSLGLGWGNHDHHTFRCSREHFVDLVNFLLKLGFAKRERYYAGAEAGWGAQVSEQPVTGIVVFADVDLLPHETAVDFSTRKLSPAPRRGRAAQALPRRGLRDPRRARRRRRGRRPPTRSSGS